MKDALKGLGQDNLRERFVVAVCGGAEFKDEDFVTNVLSELKPDVIVTRDTLGADALAARYAISLRVPLVRYKKEFLDAWNNTILFDEQNPSVLVVFPGKGTWGMVHEAQQREIPVITVEKDD